MFIGTRSETQFGFWDVVTPILSSAISVGGNIASARIQASAAKDVAKIQAQTTQAMALAQERLAQLQLQTLGAHRISETSPATVAAAQPAPLQAGFVPEVIAGVPTLYLLGGGLVLLFLVTRDSDKRRR